MTVMDRAGSTAEADASALPAPQESDAPGGDASGATSGWMYVVQASLLVLAVLLLSFVLNLVVGSHLEYKAAQHRLFDQFRQELALGTAPLGQTQNGHLLASGTPVALLDIPSIGLHHVVVVEGTTAAVLMSGPGHRRDTPLPGQGGGVASYILGRAASYGGPFGRIHELRSGAKITVTTGQGASTFSVIDVRRAGDPEPAAPSAIQGRLTLETATGTSYVPSGTLLVDANLVSPTFISPPTAIALGSIPADERPMAGQTNTLWALVLWLQALLAVSVAGVWSWRRWGRAQTWVVFLPLVLLVGFFLTGQVDKLLPNLL